MEKELKAKLDHLGIKLADVARELRPSHGLDATKLTKIFKGDRTLKAVEAEAIKGVIRRKEAAIADIAQQSMNDQQPAETPKASNLREAEVSHIRRATWPDGTEVLQFLPKQGDAIEVALDLDQIREVRAVLRQMESVLTLKPS